MIISILNARSITLEISLMFKLLYTMMKRIKYFYIKLILFFLINIFLAYFVVYNWPLNCNFDTPIVIPKGSSLHNVISTLEDNTCYQDNGLLKTLMVASGNDKNIIPGRYDLGDIKTIGHLIKKITQNTKELEKMTVLEGWTLYQTSRKIHEILEIDTLEFISLCNDKNFIASLNIGSPKNLEGYLFPETYSFPSNRIKFDLTAREVLSTMVNQFKKEYGKVITDKHNLSIHEIVTLASIVQGECVYDDEMSLVSSVYTNRLNKNWLLQADPTIQYLNPGKNRRLYNKDYKRFNNPYNTYIYKGLPPGPINSPGIEAIKAAAYPEETSYMFFVAKGDNRHHFSVTEDEHNKAKHKYLKNLW